MKEYQFELEIQQVEGIDGAYVVLPLDLPEQFGMGRMKVHASFDGIGYEGSIVADKLEDGSKRYILGMKKDIRAALGKAPGDMVELRFCNAQLDGTAWSYYKILVAKVEAKGRTKAELGELAAWLLGYEETSLTEAVLSKISYGEWLEQAPLEQPKAALIKGKICGFEVSVIKDAAARRMRQLDKLCDLLAKGKPIEKIIPEA